MRAMWDNRYFQGWDEPDFKDGFPDPANKLPELWSKYEDKTLEALDSKGEGDGEESDEKDEDVNYMSTRSVSDKLDIHINTVRNWIDDGRFDTIQLPNGEHRIPEKQVEEILS